MYVCALEIHKVLGTFFYPFKDLVEDESTKEYNFYNQNHPGVLFCHDCSQHDSTMSKSSINCKTFKFSSGISPFPPSCRKTLFASAVRSRQVRVLWVANSSTNEGGGFRQSPATIGAFGLPLSRLDYLVVTLLTSFGSSVSGLTYITDLLLLDCTCSCD